MSFERSQPIRPTQFITTYGPGAILESLRGPRLIFSTEESGLFNKRDPKNFEIVEPSLSQLLPENGRIFRLPGNAELDLDDSRAIYNTRNFPTWSLCPKHGVLYKATYDSRKSCPKCPATNKYEDWEQARQQAISFVMACEAGHLSDVGWNYLLHQEAASRDCQPDYIYWRGAGGPLKGARLECPKCKATVGLGELYHREHTCGGMYLEKKVKDTCTVKARISQRAASDLFLPEVRSALTLPRCDSPLHTALRHNSVFSAAVLLLNLGMSITKEQWDQIVNAPNVPASVRDEILKASVEQRMEVAKSVLADSMPVEPNEARAAELRTLLESAPAGQPSSPNFEIDPSSARVFPLGEWQLRVTPVNRLRMVTAQIGYRRLGGDIVQSEFAYQSDLWFPGVEQFGEGLFLELLNRPKVEGSATWQSWMDRFDQSGEASDHPMMVWWHTLSHRLIRALAVDSGYSAASVRERLYLSGETGGLLIYAVQPGGDGTLGGLIALLSRFDRILSSALDYLDSCSNDPLCGDQKISRNRKNGAACYACSLLSETSCEMRNFSLDRRILIETVL